MPAHKEEVAQARDEGIAIVYLAGPVRLLRRGGRVTHLECVRMSLSEKMGKDGRREAVPIKESIFALPVDVVISAVGWAIRTGVPRLAWWLWPSARTARFPRCSPRAKTTSATTVSLAVNP